MQELELLADWFERAITAYGQGSIRATARVAQLDERPLYSLVNAERLLPLPLVRALAAGLEQDLGEAEQLWSEAKRQLEQAADKRRRERQPTVGGWADIGHPEPALRDLLEAQSSLLDCLPYRQLGLVEPLLSAVFVNQAVRHLPPDPELEGPESAAAEGRLPVPANEAPTTPTATASTRSSALQRETGRSEDVPPVNLAEALNQHESLLVIGDPGSGKSTLANQLGHRLAQLWLRETAVHKAPLVEVVVPLRLPATLLADEEGPWSETVRNTVRRSLGRGLVSEPSASLFSGRVAGARWLLFVDGLDEIADVNQRTDLIRTLAGHTRPGGAFRFVITTRPLSNSELAPLRAATVGCYEMQPFDRDQLAAYARRWFEQQPRHTPDAERSSKRFLDDTKGGALQELVKNPLLATIALVQATLRPAQPLPTSLIALYRSFIEILRRNRLPAPAGQNGPTTPSWVVDILDHLLATLAQRQVEGNEDHLGDIEPLVRSALGELRPLPTDWQQTVTSAVNQSGIVVITGDRIRFTHHSFAEFLTSRLQAEAVGDDEQLLERWIWQAGDSAQRSLARFTLWHWAEGPVGSPERLVAKVLSFPGVESTLHAASLLAEGLNAMPQQVAEVCTRLCGIVRMAAPNSPPTEAAGLLAALVWRYPTAQLLEGLVRNTFLPATVRYQALEALSRSCPAELSTSLLDLLLEHLYEVLPEAAALSLTLNASAPHRVRQRLGDMLAEVDADEWEWTAAAEGYRALGDLSEAAEQARRVLEQPTAAVAYRRRAAKTWLALGEITQQADSLTAIAWAGDSSDHAGRLVFAQELADAGATDAAGKLLLTLLTCDDAQDQHEVAAGLWLRLDNARAVQPVAELFERLQALGADVWQLARLVELLGATHPGLPGVEWCRMTLPSASPWPVGGVDVLQAWASLAGPDCWDELSALVADGNQLNNFELRSAAQLFLDAGRPGEARALAHRALRTTTLRAYHLTSAAEILLKCDRENSIAQWATQVKERRGSSLWAHSVLEALDEIHTPELKELSLGLAKLILGTPRPEAEHVATALYVRFLLDGPEALPGLVDLACHHPWLNNEKRREVARHFAAFNESAAARAIWRYMLSVRGRSSEGTGLEIVEDILQMESPHAAIDILQGLLVADPPPAPLQRRRLERLLNWVAAEPTRF